MFIKVAKNDFTRKRIILSPLQKLPKNVRDLGKLIVAKGFKKLPKVQKNRPIWSHWLHCARQVNKAALQSVIGANSDDPLIRYNCQDAISLSGSRLRQLF